MDMSGLSRCVCDVERPEIVTCEGRLITLNVSASSNCERIIIFTRACNLYP